MLECESVSVDFHCEDICTWVDILGGCQMTCHLCPAPEDDAAMLPFIAFHILQKTISQNHDLAQAYKEYVKAINPVNLAHFIESYIK